MKEPSFSDAFQVLVLQAADDGREKTLFGESAQRARNVVPPFLVGEKFPSTYLEFPLIGSPFMDVTLLYDSIAPGTRINSDAAAGTEAMLDWYASVEGADDNICCGFELDTKEESLPQAAVHFQPRKRKDLVEPFCAAVGEPAYADLYLNQNERMPQGWPLSFFGMFRGRPGTPLRVCGYLDSPEQGECAADTAHLAAAFDQMGFRAYDDAMLAQVSQAMGIAPDTVDFQLDVFPDGHLGNTFAIDVQFAIEQPHLVRENFQGGPVARVMQWAESLGAADERWKLAADIAFARAIPIEMDDGAVARYSFTIMPQWMKLRWRAGALQPSKLYLMGKAGVIDE